MSIQGRYGGGLPHRTTLLAILLTISLIFINFLSVNSIDARSLRIVNPTILTALDSYVAEEEPHGQYGSEGVISIGHTESFHRRGCSLAWLGPSAKPSGCIITCEQDYEGTRRNVALYFGLGSTPSGSKVEPAIPRLHAYSSRDDAPLVPYGLTEGFSEAGGKLT